MLIAESCWCIRSASSTRHSLTACLPSTACVCVCSLKAVARLWEEKNPGIYALAYERWDGKTLPGRRWAHPVQSGRRAACFYVQHTHGLDGFRALPLSSCQFIIAWLSSRRLRRLVPLPVPLPVTISNMAVMCPVCSSRWPKVWTGSPNECRTSAECCMLGSNSVFYWWAQHTKRPGNVVNTRVSAHILSSIDLFLSYRTDSTDSRTI